MIQYCTPADVREIGREFSWEVVEDQLTDERIIPVIEESSYEVMHILQPRFDLSVINASVPFAVLKLTALISVKKIFDRYYSRSTDASQKEVDRLKKAKDFWLKLIVNGTILDANGLPIATDFEPSVIKQSPTNVEKIYECTSRSYNSWQLIEDDNCGHDQPN